MCRLPEKGRKEIEESRGDEREGQGRKRNRNESEETEEIKTFPSTLTNYKDSRPCPTVSQYQLEEFVFSCNLLLIVNLHETNFL